MVRLLTRAAYALTAASLALGLASSALAAADPVAGKSVFAAQCSTCHSAVKNGGALIGPNLYGVVGRKSGSMPGFAYSAAMKGAGVVWSDDELRKYLPNPRGAIPGIKMTYFGLKNPVQLENLIAYLNTLK
jgi:cytochrome c